jgi:hypothetical protein
MQSAFIVSYCYLWRVWLYHIFLHCLITGKIFRKKYEYEMCVWFSLQYFSEIFLILRKPERDIITNLYRPSYKVPVILVRF